MPVKKSAIKELKKTKKRTIRNTQYKRGLDFLMRKFKKALSEKSSDQVTDYSKKIIKKIDKMVQKGVLKKNTAARKKSRLMKKVNNLISPKTTQPEPAPETK